MSFRSLQLTPEILKAIGEAGYTEPTPIQVAAIPLILAGHDVIGIAQTGTGKTAAFVLPILMKLSKQTVTHADHAARNRQSGSDRRPRALVVAPTRELVVQIEENVRIYAKHTAVRRERTLRREVPSNASAPREAGDSVLVKTEPLRMVTVYGGVSERPQIAALRSGVDLVVATPGRLIDLMDQRVANLSGIEFLVLDEADRMLDMGFLPPIRRIVKALSQRRQTLMFSATFSREIEQLTHQFQRSPKIVQIGRRANPAETVAQFAYEVRPHLKSALLQHLLGDPKFDTVLVFVRTKRGADKLARRLESGGIRTGTIHSNRSQNQRLRALKDFKSGAVRVLVATDIAARGIDVDGISHVVNYDFPMHSEDYVHRIGRTGRAHAVGDAISFITPEDHGPLRSLERFIGRGILRKKAEGFDYHAAAPPRHERRRGEPRAAKPKKIEPRLPGNSTRGSGAPTHHGGGSRERTLRREVPKSPWRPSASREAGESVRETDWRPGTFAPANFRPRRRSYRRHR